MLYYLGLAVLYFILEFVTFVRGAGVNIFNVGGAIARADNPANVYATLTNEINKQGVI